MEIILITIAILFVGIGWWTEHTYKKYEQMIDNIDNMISHAKTLKDYEVIAMMIRREYSRIDSQYWEVRATLKNRYNIVQNKIKELTLK